jgi:hypothetical protein
MSILRLIRLLFRLRKFTTAFVALEFLFKLAKRKSQSRQ